MKELIEVLNQTSGIRVVFYSFVLISIVYIIGETIVQISNNFRRKN